MKNNIKNIFVVLALIVAVTFNIMVPQVVSAASDYVCADDSSYDPYEPSQGLPSGLSYSQATGHEYGKCKDGKSPIAVSASGYVCFDDEEGYDPYRTTEGIPSDHYKDSTGHEYGKCKDGSTPINISAPESGDVDPVYNNNGACGSRFLGFPAWYRGLVDESSGKCDVKLLGSGTDGLSKSIWKIVLNVIEAAMMLVGYLSVIFIIYGGVLYITSAGDSKGVEKAKSSITNAVIGLVISIVAVAVVEFIFNQLLLGVA